jgi:lipoate-protein ligase A
VAAGTWRLLRDAPAGAAWNMSVDEALLEGLPGSGPTLRLYGWARPSVSLGYRQKPPAWLPRCAALGVPVVRRATGGGTVLHDGDLTYSVAIPRDCEDLPGDLRGSYEWIRGVLIEGLRARGLAAAPARPSDCAPRAELCFAGATGAEIDLAERKLVGSAQRRLPHGLLQHGSIRVKDDQDLYRTLFGKTPGPPAISLESPEQLADGLVDAFRKALRGRLIGADLRASEVAEARRRQLSRFANPLARPPLSSRGATGCADRLP